MDDVYLMAFHPEDDGEEVEFLEDNFETENDFYMVLIGISQVSSRLFRRKRIDVTT